jgi:hypothetical protein
MKHDDFTPAELSLICDALEELYDNIQYYNITDQKLRDQQQDISALMGKILQEELA